MRRIGSSGTSVGLLVAAGAAYVMYLVGQQTIAIAGVRRLLPRWDLAAHLLHGWVDYDLLTTGRIHLLLWDLWQQGYWPPGLSLWQMPFYAGLGGRMTAGLWSSAAAFVLAAATGAAVLVKQRSGSGPLAASIFVALLISSPYVLAFSSLAMTEVPGALAQLLVLYGYLAWRQNPDERRARLFALSLTVLFFVKYNYFVMLAVPLVLHELLERTSGWTTARRAALVGHRVRRILASFSGRLLMLYLAALLIVTATGGFQLRVLGQRISVRGVGNSGLIVLYVLMVRLWYLHRRRRVDWHGLVALDSRIRPLLIWFVVPVAVWLASPYPNHIRDFWNLVINRPHGEQGLASGAGAYWEALRSLYFYHPWVLAAAAAVLVIAVLRYRVQPPLMRLLVLAVPLQLAAIGLHQTWSTRFLVLPVVLLCLAAAGEVGQWFRASSSRGRMAVALLASAVLAAGLAAARLVVKDERFRFVAFEPYTESAAARSALDAVRGELDADDRLLLVGQSDQLSPALFKWELGPPSGVPCFPFEIGGAGRLDPSLATHILMVTPVGAGGTPLGYGSNDPARLHAILTDIARGELILHRDFVLTDLQVTMSLYVRASRPVHATACRAAGA